MTEEGRDDLDDFMSLVSKRLDKKTRISMKHRLAFLRKVSCIHLLCISNVH